MIIIIRVLEKWSAVELGSWKVSTRLRSTLHVSGGCSPGGQINQPNHTLRVPSRTLDPLIIGLDTAYQASIRPFNISSWDISYSIFRSFLFKISSWFRPKKSLTLSDVSASDLHEPPSPLTPHYLLVCSQLRHGHTSTTYVEYSNTVPIFRTMNPCPWLHAGRWRNDW